MLVPEVTPDNAVTPLDTLDELLSFKSPPLCAVQPLRDVARGRPEDPKTLLCHDHVRGCYQQDRFVHGCANPNAYRFYHWQVIDTFVYYSPYLVTIPPPGWISAAHRHGVKVLGTFLVKSQEGTEVLDRIRRDNLLSKVASQLALVADLSRFDGWFIDVESKMEECHIGFLKDLLLAITTQTHQSVPGSLVIWYDSITNDGTLDWQSELNEKNCDFFDLCDGIFLNSRWTEDRLRQSAFFAGTRKSDIYVGIDVYAPTKNYIGGFDTYRVVDTARKFGLSAAIFGASWAYEANDKRRFIQNQGRLWSFPDHCCPKWRLRAPPISTSFCQGFGYSLYKEGQVVSTQPWFDLSKQQLQPRDQSTWLCQGCGTDTGEREELQLGIVVVAPDDHYAVARDVSLPSFDDSVDASGYSWMTRRYNIEDLRTAADCANLEEIGHFVCLDASKRLPAGRTRGGTATKRQPGSSCRQRQNASNDSGPEAAISSDEFDVEEAPAS
ncbi:hypothetical protein MTO96_027993 [Rhipicephalus appendiculatus]